MKGFLDAPDASATYGVADFDADGRHVIAGSNTVLARIPLDPMLLLTPGERLKMACKRARDLGFTGFTQADRDRFATLDDNFPDNPCVARGIIAAAQSKPVDTKDESANKTNELVAK